MAEPLFASQEELKLMELASWLLGQAQVNSLVRDLRSWFTEITNKYCSQQQLNGTKKKNPHQLYNEKAYRVHKSLLFCCTMSQLILIPLSYPMPVILRIIVTLISMR
jgi:hypothetical protein